MRKETKYKVYKDSTYGQNADTYTAIFDTSHIDQMILVATDPSNKINYNMVIEGPKPLIQKNLNVLSTLLDNDKRQGTPSKKKSLMRIILEMGTKKQIEGLFADSAKDEDLRRTLNQELLTSNRYMYQNTSFHLLTSWFKDGNKGDNSGIIHQVHLLMLDKSYTNWCKSQKDTILEMFPQEVVLDCFNHCKETAKGGKPSADMYQQSRPLLELIDIYNAAGIKVEALDITDEKKLEFFHGYWDAACQYKEIYKSGLRKIIAFFEIDKIKDLANEEWVAKLLKQPLGGAKEKALYSRNYGPRDLMSGSLYFALETRLAYLDKTESPGSTYTPYESAIKEILENDFIYVANAIKNTNHGHYSFADLCALSHLKKDYQEFKKTFLSDKAVSAKFDEKIKEIEKKLYSIKAPDWTIAAYTIPFLAATGASVWALVTFQSPINQVYFQLVGSTALTTALSIEIAAVIIIIATLYTVGALYLNEAQSNNMGLMQALAAK